MIPEESWLSKTILITGSCHDANFDATGGTIGCHKRILKRQLSWCLLLSSLVKSEVVVMTTSGATGDDKVGITTALSPQWNYLPHARRAANKINWWRIRFPSIISGIICWVLITLTHWDLAQTLKKKRNGTKMSRFWWNFRNSLHWLRTLVMLVAVDIGSAFLRTNHTHTHTHKTRTTSTIKFYKTQYFS